MQWSTNRNTKDSAFLRKLTLLHSEHSECSRVNLSSTISSKNMRSTGSLVGKALTCQASSLDSFPAGDRSLSIDKQGFIVHSFSLI